MDINLDKTNSLSNELNTPKSLKFAKYNSYNLDISKRKLDILKKHNFGLKIPDHPMRYYFAKKLNSASKLFSSVLEPTALSLVCTQNALKKFIVDNPILKGNMIGISQSIVLSISSGINITRLVLDLPDNIRSSHEMENIRKSFVNQFDKSYSYDWAKNNTTISALHTEYIKVKEQLELCDNMRIKLSVSKNSPNINEQLRQINLLIDRKKLELKHINEYISIKNLEDISHARIKNKVRSIFYSTMWLTLRTSVIAACAFCGTSYIYLNSNINLFNNFSNHALKFKDHMLSISRNISNNFRKRQAAYNFTSFVSSIPCNYINIDIVKRSKLGFYSLSKKDFDTLLLLKNKTSSDFYFELPKNLRSALTKIGTTYLEPEDVNIIDNYIKDIEASTIDSLGDFRGVVTSLRHSINEYNSLVHTIDMETIRYHNDMYSIKEGLHQAYDKNINIFSSGDGLFNRVLRGQFLSNQTIFNIAVFDYFANNNNLCSKFKNIIDSPNTIKNNSIWQSFNSSDIFNNKHTFNDYTADYIIDMVKSLPPKLKLIKDDTEVNLDSLDLYDENDRMLLNEVYENWALYEHAKSFINSCLSNNTENSLELINKILNANDENSINEIKENLIKELSSLN